VVQINTVSAPQKAHTKPVRAGTGRSKTTEPTVRGRIEDIRDASQVPLPSAGQSRREKLLAPSVRKEQSPVLNPVWVPVISSTGTPLMPCRPAYARALIKSGRAQRRWFKGIFAIKMLDRAEGKVQQVVCGIDPGSKREAFTVQSKQHTYLNVLSDAVTWVSDRVEVRRNMRRGRRFRKTPCRKNKFNRNINCKGLLPSIKSRWQIKLNIIKFLKKMYPISDICVEDIKAPIYKRGKRWNVIFSPMEIGKNWFYSEISKLGNLIKKRGYETFEKRNQLGFKKIKNKMSETFFAHNVDSWVLSSFITEKNFIDNITLFRIIPLQLHRRYLHRSEPQLCGKRKTYGGTKSVNFKRGSVVNNHKFGLVYVGGTMNGKISLHDIGSGRRLTQKSFCQDNKFFYCNSWKTQFLKKAN
jgi:RRXRR protein